MTNVEKPVPGYKLDSLVSGFIDNPVPLSVDVTGFVTTVGARSR